MRRMKKSSMILGVLVMSLVLLTGCGGSSSKDNDEVITFKMGLVDPENSNYGQGALKIAEEVAKATDGRIQIEVYAGGQLGNERDMFEGCQLGIIDICTAANPVMSAFIPEMAVLDQPFLFDTAEQAHNVIDGELGELINEKTKSMGIQMVGWMESGFRNVFSAKPIRTLKDFNGVKIRTMENKTHIAAFNALGAIATPMAAGEQYTALQQGTIDAAENATVNMLVNKFYEVIKNHTRTQHAFVFIGIGVSDKAWNQIPDELKPAFIEGVRKGCNYQRQLLVEANQQAEAELKNNGVQFHEIDIPSLKKTLTPAMAQFINAIPQEWVDAIENGKNQ